MKHNNSISALLIWLASGMAFGFLAIVLLLPKHSPDEKLDMVVGQEALSTEHASEIVSHQNQANTSLSPELNKSELFERPLPDLSVPPLSEINSMRDFAKLDPPSELQGLAETMEYLNYQPGTVPDSLGSALYEETGLTSDEMWAQLEEN